MICFPQLQMQYVMDIGKPTEMSQWANPILLSQLMATLVHHLMISQSEALPGLANWSAFLGQILQIM